MMARVGIQRFGALLMMVATVGWSGERDYRVIRDTAVVRVQPRADSTAVVRLSKGARLRGDTERGNWVQVRTEDDLRGWIFKGSVEAQQYAAFEELFGDELGDYWVLAIGIDRYQYWPALRNAVNDARGVVGIMTKHYGVKAEHVVTLFDEQATKENIFNAFLDLKARLKDRDSLLIYYAGHGVLDDFGDGSWIPAGSRKGQFADYIDTARINRMIGKLPARHVFLVADACYSGSLFATRGVRRPVQFDNRYFVENNRRMSRQALTSGGIEEVLDDGRNGHSIFAYHFLRELELNREPYLPASRLASRVEEMVVRNAAQEPRYDHLRNTQDEDGEFFFIRRQVDQPDRIAQSLTTVYTNLLDEVSIYVEGENLGPGPVTLADLHGTITVEARSPGYKPATETVRIRYDRPQAVALTLVPEDSATLVLNSDPAGARWYLDGQYMGTTPDTVSDFPSGVHRVRITKPGFQDWEQAVTVAAQTRQQLFAPLEKAGRPRWSSDDELEVEALLVEFVHGIENKDLQRFVNRIFLPSVHRDFLLEQFQRAGSIQAEVDSYYLSADSVKAVVLVGGRVTRAGNQPQQRRLEISLEQRNGRWVGSVLP